MRRIGGFLGTFGVFLALCSVSLYGQSDEALPTLKISTKLRVLDVTVVDKHGNPVTTGLSKKDFTITDNKTKKDILSFEAPNATPDAKDLSTETIFVIDHVNTPFEDQAWQQREMELYLKDQGERLNQPTELLLLKDNGLQTVEGFTQDRGDLLTAVQHMPSEIPIRLTSNWDIENLSLAMSALEEIALQTRTTPGRKNVIWIGSGGAGVNTDGAYNTQLLQRFVKRTANGLVESRVTLFLVLPSLRVGGVVQARGSISQTQTSTDIVNGSGQAPVQAQATDPFRGGVNMRMFAQVTGGQLFLNGNDLVTEIHDSLALGTKFYTLSYRPSTDGSDGSFKRIEIKLSNPNLRVLTKNGYYSEPKNADVTTADDEARFEVRKAASSEVAFKQITVGVKGVTQYAAERTAVFEIALKPGELKLAQRPDGVWAGEVVIAAVSTDGARDVLANASKAMAVTASTDAVAHANVPLFKLSITLRVPRRTSKLRFVVRDMTSGKIGSADLSRKDVESVPVASGPMPVPQARPAATPLPQAGPGA